MQVFRFHAFISVSTNRTCESSGRASPDKLKPVVARIRDAAFAVAAELWAFGDTAWITHSSQEQVDSVAEIASLIIDRPIWGFWWD
jgi:hypothetical protein